MFTQAVDRQSVFAPTHGRYSPQKEGQRRRTGSRQLKDMRMGARKLRFIHTGFAMERDLIVGGQAVMEGVMMRTPSAYAIACRRSDGSIVHTAESLPKWSDKYKWLSWPVLRGGATLIQSMALGVKALNFSARVFEEDHEAQEEKVGEVIAEEEVALVSGTVDDNFT